MNNEFNVGDNVYTVIATRIMKCVVDEDIGGSYYIVNFSECKDNESKYNPVVRGYDGRLWYGSISRKVHQLFTSPEKLAENLLKEFYKKHDGWQKIEIKNEDTWNEYHNFYRNVTLKLFYDGCWRGIVHNSDGERLHFVLETKGLENLEAAEKELKMKAGLSKEK